ncbi:hypothetical protein [Shewanella algidipiscicola]|uniref:hypothetical protein n=1 Tax=Shewanella algidipiscicola TaxID=614070 RepID=UPI000D782D32|nr:hypothetical protein [Shewanella algidipiscicola]
MPTLHKILIALVCTMLLIACGGGDDNATPVCPNNVPCDLLAGNNDTVTDPQSEYEVTLTIVDAAGKPLSSITSVSSARLIATINGINEPVIVTFNSTIGEIPIKTAVTNDMYQASVDIFSGTELGAGTVTASLVSGEEDTAIIVIGATNLTMGSGDPLQAGIAALGTNTLSAGGTTNVSVMVLNEDGQPFNEPAEVLFTSNCSNASTPLAQLDSPVTLVNGQASSTYTANGCSGQDKINVVVNTGSQVLTASATVMIQPAAAGSIRFIDAQPELIAIKTTGGQETSTVTFQVFDITGKPVANKSVRFRLNTEMGNLFLSNDEAVSDAKGFVKTVVNSGSVATSVRVLAQADSEIDNSELITQSSKLVISTGIPDQNSFTLRPNTFNPGTCESVEITAALADAFNNFPADGTAVIFTTEGGAIDGTCFTVDGQCSVEWRHLNPIPSDGRSTITATAIGEESFADTNGNGRFDLAEFNAYWTTGIDNRIFDMDEAFTDYNENGKYDPDALEELFDLNNDGEHTKRDGVYNGVLCALPPHIGCADGVNTSKSINIRDEVVIIMSTDVAQYNNLTITDSDGNDDGNQTLDIVDDKSGQITLNITNSLGNQMPAGTIVKFTSTIGEFVSQNSFIWPNTSALGGQTYGVIIQGEKMDATGYLTVTLSNACGFDATLLNIPIITTTSSN